MPYREQRVRDPLHDLIVFPADSFHDVLWQVIQTREFQRLRRVKQLGFSDFVYPGATHSRFAHSLGVFHTARMLMKIIQADLERNKEFDRSKADAALAAALVHDLGHGPFSHAFEDVGRRLGLKMAHHEHVSDVLIRQSEVATVLNRIASGFANDVAAVVKGGRSDIYGAVVSSQFDADRLDYMRRDRLMTGTHHGAIDFEWLMSNIEVGEVGVGVDNEDLGSIRTFVLGPKAIYAAEAYVLGLFQLYPTVYFHKATRGAEKLFTALLERVFILLLDGSRAQVGLPSNHPLCIFAKKPDSVTSVLALDDSVIWGSLSVLSEARDTVVSKLASRLRDRKLFKSINVRQQVSRRLFAAGQSSAETDITIIAQAVQERVEEWLAAQSEDNVPRILIDKANREPYNQLQESKGPLNQIRIRTDEGLIDLGERSKVVKAIEPFRLFRLYMSDTDPEALAFIEKTIADEIQNAKPK